MSRATEIASQIEPHIPALRRYAFALTHDHSFCDDLVQDTLERALSRWSLRKADGDPRAWMFSILHNLFISGVRARRRRGGHESLEDRHSSEAGGQEWAIVGRDIQKSLQSLPDDQRAVILLVGVEGMSYETAGRVLGIPLGTVMSRLSRGRDHMRRLMEGERPSFLKRVK